VYNVFRDTPVGVFFDREIVDNGRISTLYSPVTEKRVVDRANHGRRETVERTSKSDFGRVGSSYDRGLSPVEHPTAK